ncbi:hypothetical protein LIA77_07117 [Sarocladium implicatum]|nr:hypothetical protein LIA77_07117 [Sarocladium implicatum]
MACGHHTISTVCDPTKAHEVSCEEQRQRFIYDTCASCDPEYRRRVLKKQYDKRHALLISLYLKAKADGDNEAMKELENLMVQAVQDMRRQNFEISLIRRNAMVAWPQAEESHDGNN